MTSDDYCRTCRGSGRMDGYTCPECRGSGADPIRAGGCRSPALLTAGGTREIGFAGISQAIRIVRANHPEAAAVVVQAASDLLAMRTELQRLTQEREALRPCSGCGVLCLDAPSQASHE